MAFSKKSEASSREANVLPRTQDSERRERRTSSTLARRIATKLLLQNTIRARASVDVAGGGRVHVTLQRYEQRLHIVALCPKRLEATVVRALAQARFALARRGISAEMLVRGSA